MVMQIVCFFSSFIREPFLSVKMTGFVVNLERLEYKSQRLSCDFKNALACTFGNKIKLSMQETKNERNKKATEQFVYCRRTAGHTAVQCTLILYN